MKRSFQSTGLVVLGTGLVACTYGLVRYAYGLAVPAAQRDLGLSSSAVGLVSGATSVAYCVAAVLAFAVCERWPRAVVAAAGGVAALGATAAGLASSAGGFALAVVVGSAGAGAASPGLVVLVRNGVAATGQDRAQGTVNSGTGPGLVAAGVLALLAGTDWQQAWVVAGAVTAVVTAALLAVAPRPAPVAGPVPVDVGRSWLRPLVAAALLGVSSAAVWTWGRTVLEGAGLSGTEAVGAWVCLGLGSAAAALVAPALLARGVGVAWACSALATGGTTAALALPLPGPLPWLVPAAFGLAFTVATTVLIAWAARVSTTPGPAVAALFVSLLLGQAAGAPLAGALLGPGTVVALGVAGGVAVLAAGLGGTNGTRTPGNRSTRTRIAGTRMVGRAAGNPPEVPGTNTGTTPAAADPTPPRTRLPTPGPPVAGRRTRR